MTERVVWVPDWEMQCCGESFSVGSTVSWPVSTPEPSIGLPSLGQRADEITYSYNKHGVDKVGRRSMRGRVMMIEAVYCRFKNRSAPGYPRVFVQVPDSATIELRTNANGWEDDGDGDPRFIGYVVHLTERRRDRVPWRRRSRS